jgi:hypothetical protein
MDVSAPNHRFKGMHPYVLITYYRTVITIA